MPTAPLTVKGGHEQGNRVNELVTRRYNFESMIGFEFGWADRDGVGGREGPVESF
jgi:hypothetical protein